MKAGIEGLVEQFLDSCSGHTRLAYTTDLDDFARFRHRHSPAAAIAGLLAGREQGRGLILDYAAAMLQSGRARPTVCRRINTLRSVARMAGERGLIERALEMPNEEQIAAAKANQPPSGHAYILPRHPSEIDRLDIQHYALREKLQANFLAPVGAPETILDVGSGTGQWAFDVCAEFPMATVVGLDLVTSKPGPDGYRFVRANALHGLPFATDSFDFVHMRFLTAGLPLKSWSAVVRELVRVARPGGWVELAEAATWIRPAGPATTHLSELTFRLARDHGLDTTGIVFRSLDEWPRRAGLSDVERRTTDLPMGEWGGRVGSFIASDFRAVFTRLCDVFEARFGLRVPEGHELVRQTQLEWEQDHSMLDFVVAFGRKPSSC